MTKAGIPKVQVYSSEARLLCSLCSSWRKRGPPEGGLEQLAGVWNPRHFSTLTTGCPSSQIVKSSFSKWGQDKSYILQGAEDVLPEPVTFHFISMPWSVWKGRPCSARGWKGKRKHPVGFMGVRKHGFLLSKEWGILSQTSQVGWAALGGQCTQSSSVVPGDSEKSSAPGLSG